MKIAVIYDSKTGNTKQAAKWIVEGMDQTEGVEAQAFSIQDMDEVFGQEACGIVVGSPSYAALMTPDMHAWLLSYAGKLGFAGKLGGAFATEQFTHGGGETVIQSILTIEMVNGIIGTMAEESKLRTQHWLQEGCNAYDAKRPTSKPMSFWTEADVWQYIRENNIPYSKIYDMGYGRTGCIFCMFGAHFDGQPTRFQRLQRTHPKLWRYCMKDWEAGGLGMRQVLEYMGIPFENYIGEINGNTENSSCPLESCGLQSPCRSQAGRQGIRETETVNQ